MYTLKTKLKQGQLTIGTMISEVRNPNLAYMLARCGFDFFVIDNEHGAYSSETVANMIAAARGAGISVVVRIPEIRRETIMKPLDAGAAGLLVPMVDTVEQAREVISHAKYPPVGCRGVGLRRAHSLYRKVDAADYLKQANEDTLISVQAETMTAIENLEDIVTVPGIDAVFVGPMDLSVNLGIPARFDDPRQIHAIERVIEVCDRHGAAAGILSFDLQSLQKWIQKGMRYVLYGADVSLLADAAASGVDALRKVIAR